MQEVSEACRLDDDMVDGDLGDGMGVRAAPNSTRKKSQSFTSVIQTLLPEAEWLRQSTQIGEAAWIPGLKTANTQQRARWKLSHAGKNENSPFTVTKELNKNEIIQAGYHRML